MYGDHYNGHMSYHLETRTRYDRVGDTLGSLLASLPISPRRVLDFGCSTGETTVELAYILREVAQEVVGIDINSTVIGQHYDSAIRAYNSGALGQGNEWIPCPIDFFSIDGYSPQLLQLKRFDLIIAMNNLLYEFRTLVDSGQAKRIKPHIIALRQCLMPSGILLVSSDLDTSSAARLIAGFQENDQKLTLWHRHNDWQGWQHYDDRLDAFISLACE